MGAALDGKQPAAAAAPGRRPAWWRIPFLLLGFVALFAGAGAGLARLGYHLPAVITGVAALHGPLMICGFFGVVIALERAVAIGRGWAYAAPLLAGLGSAAVLHGAAPVAPWLYLGGSVVLLLASLDVWRRQRALFTFTLALAAACWAAGVAAWAAGAAVHQVVPWWVAFLVLTIAGERLELSRFMPPSPRAQRVFAALLALGVAVLLADGAIALRAGAHWPFALHAWGASLVALALWLLRFDIARRTVRQHGLTRFIAVCLLSGYAWLAVGGAVIAFTGALNPGTPAYDAALHALLLGFVFSMVFGHAPIVFPSVLRVAVPYRPVFYAPLVLLHVSLLLRVAGDAFARPLLHSGGLFSALSLLLFVAVTAGAVIGGRGAMRGVLDPRRLPAAVRPAVCSSGEGWPTSSRPAMSKDARITGKLAYRQGARRDRVGEPTARYVLHAGKESFPPPEGVRASTLPDLQQSLGAWAAEGKSLTTRKLPDR